MPEICRFYGIVIRMYFDDHNPPYFHAEYSGQEALIDVNSFTVFSGQLPPRALSLVMEWAALHKEELLACEQAKITTYLPKPQTSGSTKKGLLSKRDFVYRAGKNENACPAGERLIWQFETQEKGVTLHKYWSSRCPT